MANGIQYHEGPGFVDGHFSSYEPRVVGVVGYPPAPPTYHSPMTAHLLQLTAKQDSSSEVIWMRFFNLPVRRADTFESFHTTLVSLVVILRLSVDLLESPPAKTPNGDSE